MTLDKLESQVIALNTEHSAAGPKSGDNFVLEPSQDKTCLVEGSRGASYRGSQSITRNGFMCQKWNSQFMRSNYMSVATSQESLAELATGHNFCRNIDNDAEGPWCYTTNPRVPKDYCNIPTCGGGGGSSMGSDLVKTSVSLDKSLFKETKLIVGAGVSLLVVLVFILMVFCLCRSRGASSTVSNQHLIMHKQGEKQQQQQSASSSNANSMPMLSNLSNGTCTSSTVSQIHPSRLRMSNVSLGKKQQHNMQSNKNQRGAGSSKSSVASSSNNQHGNNMNMEVNNPFIKNNYDNHQPAMFNYQQQQQQQQQMLHQVPQFQIQMQQQQFVQQMQQQQQHQQQQMMNNDCDYSVKQYSANNLRLLQEIGKGTMAN